jgi:hypothetical protein
MHANITLENATLDTPNVAVSVTDAPAINPPIICPFKIRQIYFLILSSGLPFNTITNALTQAL